jgi:hypothetical protein
MSCSGSMMTIEIREGVVHSRRINQLECPCGDDALPMVGLLPQSNALDLGIGLLPPHRHLAN